MENVREMLDKINDEHKARTPASLELDQTLPINILCPTCSVDGLVPCKPAPPFSTDVWVGTVHRQRWIKAEANKRPDNEYDLCAMTCSIDDLEKMAQDVGRDAAVKIRNLPGLSESAKMYALLRVNHIMAEHIEHSFRTSAQGSADACHIEFMALIASLYPAQVAANAAPKSELVSGSVVRPMGKSRTWDWSRDIVCASWTARNVGVLSKFAGPLFPTKHFRR